MKDAVISISGFFVGFFVTIIVIFLWLYFVKDNYVYKELCKK